MGGTEAFRCRGSGILRPASILHTLERLLKVLLPIAIVVASVLGGVALVVTRENVTTSPTLAASFLRDFGRELGKGPLGLSQRATTVLKGYGWPGNVRELRNLMERAAVLVAGTEVGEDLVRTLLPPAAEEEGESLDLAAAVAEVERKTILRALAATDDDKPEAAALLGIGERTLWTKLKKHHL